MLPGTGAGPDVTTTWIPFDIRDTIVLSRTEVLDANAPLVILRHFLARKVVGVDIPELKHGIVCRSHGSENNKASVRGPPNGIAGSRGNITFAKDDQSFGERHNRRHIHRSLKSPLLWCN